MLSFFGGVGGGVDGTLFNHCLVFTLLQCLYAGLGSKVINR